MDNFAPSARQTQQVETDKAFEQFICAACHNLREELRGIRLLAEAAPDCHIEDQIRAMESILASMVEYSVVGEGESRSSRVDMNGILKQVLLSLQGYVFEHGVAHVVTHDPLPSVMGNAGDLASVLRHLLDNAIKFCGENPPQIHISAKRDGLQWVLSVRDNGPGIEAPYRETVFVPFKRLHGRDYPGNGLGLAICRKVIEQHGGKIWVESGSEPGTGTTVRFTLPAAD